jgi:hypothetical protein
MPTIRYLITVLLTGIILGCIGQDISCKAPHQWEVKDLQPPLKGYQQLNNTHVLDHIQAYYLPKNLQTPQQIIDYSQNLMDYINCTQEMANVTPTIYFNDNPDTFSLVVVAMGDTRVQKKEDMKYLGTCGGILNTPEKPPNTCRNWFTMQAPGRLHPTIILGYNTHENICTTVRAQIENKGDC